MSWQIFWIAIAAFAVVLGLSFAFRRPKRREAAPRDVGKHPALGAGYREGQTMGFSPADEPWDRAERNVRDHPPREASHHPRPFPKPHEHILSTSRKPLGKPVAAITLTPRQLEHINIQRRAAGKQPMNNLGFRSAIAFQAAAAAPLRSSSDWLVYLILYEVLFVEHHSSRVYVDTGGITITPDAPFNGQDGTFGGAGVTSSFGSSGELYKALAAVGTSVDGSLDEAYSPPQSAPEPQREQPAEQPEQPQSAPEPTPEPSGGGGIGSD